jgi:hypothetical protein
MAPTQAPDDIPPAQAELIRESVSVLPAIQSLRVDSPEQYRYAYDLLIEIKSRSKQLDGERRELVDPLGGVVRKINAKYRVALDALSQSEALLKAKLLSYDQESRVRAAEALVSAQQSSLRGDIASAQAALTRAAPDTPKIPGLSQQTVYDVEVTDITAIPREYLVPDLAALRALARESQGQAVVPGVRFSSRQVVKASIK